MVYHTPPAAHEDWFALSLLDSVLSGPSSLGGGGIDNKTSRLFKALIETEIAASADGHIQPTLDPYLYEIILTLRDGRTLEEGEAALLEQIECIRTSDISEAELAKAKKQAHALFAYSTESVTDQAFWLAFAENFESHTWFEHYVDRLQAVTIADVRRVAEIYLAPQNRTVGWFVPTGEEDFDED
jgi:zinc protease